MQRIGLGLCVCVCVREREREAEQLSSPFLENGESFQYPKFPVNPRGADQCIASAAAKK